MANNLLMLGLSYFRCKLFESQDKANIINFTGIIIYFCGTYYLYAGAKGGTESVHRNVTFFYDGLPESDEFLLDFYPKYTFMCHQGIFFLTFLAVKFQDKRSIVQSVGHEISNIQISDKTNSEMFIQVSAIKTRSKYGAKNVTVWVRE